MRPIVSSSKRSVLYSSITDKPSPVSVTESVDLARSRAVVEATEHSRSGRLLRTHVVEAAVSG